MQTPPDGTQGELGTPQTPGEQTPQIETTVTETVTTQPSIDYEKKFSESTREAQRLAQELEQERARIKSLTTNNNPTDNELRERFSNWDELNSVTQDVYRRQVAIEKQNTRLQNTLMEQIAEQKWKDELNSLTKKADYKALRDDPEFEDYVFKPNHKGLSIETLADAFMHRKGMAAPPPPTPGRPGLERGSGGPKEPEGDTQVDLQALSQQDPKKFRKDLVEGRIKLG